MREEMGGRAPGTSGTNDGQLSACILQYCAALAKPQLPPQHPSQTPTHSFPHANAHTSARPAAHAMKLCACPCKSGATCVPLMSRLSSKGRDARCCSCMKPPRCWSWRWWWWWWWWWWCCCCCCCCCCCGVGGRFDQRKLNAPQSRRWHWDRPT